MGATPLYRDPSASLDARVEDLLRHMTLDEKLAQLGGVWVTELITDDGFDVERARVRLRHGTGHVTRIGASTALGPAARARLLNDIQRFLVEDTRLGIPAIVHEESVGGLCARDATVFPQAIGLAATWDPALVEAVAGVIREQARTPTSRACSGRPTCAVSRPTTSAAASSARASTSSPTGCPRAG
ncbi:MAG: hypothetical protein E6J69_16365 [Deltaproteobacteria bacterium]|nr:MAG: hypothetical protein E6J69_16365 [Deltaproteobacteria bacterium]